jgi:hypothetical protein
MRTGTDVNRTVPEDVGHSADERRLLVERVAASRLLNRSERLRSLLCYLTDKALEDETAVIHEQSVGHDVFGRPADYNTTADNIVRVHASTLRKRLEQYFASEGSAEPLIIEIPKGNYAPVFRRREDAAPVHQAPVKTPDWRLWTLAALAALFACSTAYLALRRPDPQPASATLNGPTLRLFWGRVFQPNRQTDIVLDDAAIGLYQELTGRSVSLSNYYDRTYLRSLEETAQSIAVRRQSSYACASFLWKLFQVFGVGQRATLLRFARDYSFRELKANNAILLGNSRSNPWIESFEPRLGLRWAFDQASGNYYPVDAWSANRTFHPASPGDLQEGYVAVSLLANGAHTGSALVVTGTGGSAVNAGADFLADEQSMAALRRRLPGGPGSEFPDFEALIKVKGRGATPRDATIVICRAVPK